jgi:hypothetical protein
MQLEAQLALLLDPKERSRRSPFRSLLDEPAMRLSASTRSAGAA